MHCDFIKRLDEIAYIEDYETRERELILLAKGFAASAASLGGPDVFAEFVQKLIEQAIKDGHLTPVWTCYADETFTKKELKELNKEGHYCYPILEKSCSQEVKPNMDEGLKFYSDMLFVHKKGGYTNLFQNLCFKTRAWMQMELESEKL